MQASRRFFDILNHFSPLVESLSVDEAFLDVTGQERLMGDGPTIARAIKKRVVEEQALVVSVGVAPTKFVAKIASDIDKPDGLCVVPEQRVVDFLHPLPVSRLWGVGKVTRDKLRALGLHTIGEVAHFPETVLRARLGESTGAHLAALARGEDARAVKPHHAPVSIGHEQTFEVDIERKDRIAVVLLEQGDRVAARLRSAALRARVVQLKIRYGDFRSVTRRRTLADATSDGQIIARTAVAMLDEFTIGNSDGGPVPPSQRVRLCGVSASGLEARDAPRQLILSESERERGERLGDTLDRIQARFGRGLVRRAVHARSEPEADSPGPTRPDLESDE